MNPCYVNNRCHISAECFALNHQAQCRCPPGTTGDPYSTGCRPEGCSSDNECPFDMACISRNCVNPCIYSNPCAPNAECFVTNHRPQCRCPPGLEGNPREYCRAPQVEAEPECRQDADCSSGLACIDQRCQNPCRVLNPCNPTANCRVIDTLPVRTMICECPPGTYGDGYTACKAGESNLIIIILCMASHKYYGKINKENRCQHEIAQRKLPEHEY